MADVTPKDVWDALEAGGASSVQAAGIMGNWIAESGLNPEASAIDSNGYRSNGIAQWNEASYPQSASLVTGNPVRDLAAQVTFFFQTVPQSALQGSTPQQVASNIAADYERCQGCEGGGSQNATRQANAATVAGWASNGSWPASSGSASDTASLTSAAAAQSSATCAWQLPEIDLLVTHIGGQCLLSKSQARALLSSLILVGGGVVALLAVVMLAAETPAGKAAAGLVTKAGAAAAIA